MLQELHSSRCALHPVAVGGEAFAGEGTNRASASLRPMRWNMDVVTIAVVVVILVSYLVGSLTSSVETEQELPHRY